jgi:hypothetical protein
VTAFFHNTYSTPSDFARIITADPPHQFPVPSPVQDCRAPHARILICPVSRVAGQRKRPRSDNGAFRTFLRWRGMLF